MQKFTFAFWCWSEEQDAHDDEGDVDDFIRKVFGTDVFRDLYNLTQYTALWFGMILSLCIFVNRGMWHGKTNLEVWVWDR